MSLFTKNYSLSPDPGMLGKQSSPSLNRSSPYLTTDQFAVTLLDSPDPKSSSPLIRDSGFDILDSDLLSPTADVPILTYKPQPKLSPAEEKEDVLEWRKVKPVAQVMTGIEKHPSLLAPARGKQLYRPPGSRAAAPPPIIITKPSLPSRPRPQPIQSSSSLPRSLSVHRRKSSWGYYDYEDALRVGKEFEEKGARAVPGSNAARQALSKAGELYATALGFKPRNAEPLIAKCRIVLLLATHYDTPFVAMTDLRNAIADLDNHSRHNQFAESRDVVTLRAKLSDLLGAFLKEVRYVGPALSSQKVWSSERAEVARQGFTLWETAAAGYVQDAQTCSDRSARAAALSATEALMNLATTGSEVLSMAPTVSLVDTYLGLVELALDQASDMVMLARPATTYESTTENPFLTQISLLACDAAIKRHQQAFALDTILDEEELRGIIADLEVLSDRERTRARSMRGAKAEMAATSAFFAIKQLADARIAYAQMLRQVWRQRSRTSEMRVQDLLDSIHRITGKSAASSSASSKTPSLINRGSTGRTSFVRPRDVIAEEKDLGPRGSSSTSSESSDGLGPLTPASDGTPCAGFGSALTGSSSFSRAALLSGSTLSMDSAGSCRSTESTRSLWMPPLEARERRISSVGIRRSDSSVTAWNRKASMVSNKPSVNGTFTVSTTALCETAFSLLEAAMKGYKAGLNLLASSNLTGDLMAQTKSEVLLGIAEAALFSADLAPLCSRAVSARETNLDTCGIYARWAAREVGMASWIEGTSDSVIADRKVDSWRAKEVGKRAILTVLRMWWYKAASKPNQDAKVAAKDAIAGVLQRARPSGEVDSSSIAKYKSRIVEASGELNASESLFWLEVERILTA